MKVSDLIKYLEDYKDKELYLLNQGVACEITEVKNQVIGELLFLDIKQKPNHEFISDFEGLQKGYVVRHRTPNEMEALNKARVREQRTFNYKFEKGDKVIIDQEVVLDMDVKRLSHLFDKVGVIKKSWSEMHVFGQGRAYYHEVEWEGGQLTKDGDFVEENIEYDNETFMPKNYVPTVYLKKFEQ